MLKADLERCFGNYCDTNKLVDDVMALLTKYHYENTEHGVCEMLYEYFANKQPLIDLFMTSANYIGNMRICLNVELERTNNRNEVDAFCCNFANSVNAKSILLKYVDEYGKSIDDYTRIGVGKFKARSLYRGNMVELLAQRNENRSKFEYDGATKESYADYARFDENIRLFGYNPGTTLCDSIADALTQSKINVSLVSGMKTSRAFNRVCSHYGVDKLPNYNKMFAQYADMVSGLKRKVCFYISLNPLDYLTMSFGNSWSSCHTIDKKNERGMQNGYQGMHAGGVMSYMLDKTSVITYVHNHATENHEEGKIYRNMFHFSRGTLVQGRIYPQGNDGATDLYKEFRHIVQSEFAKLLELENNDWIRRNCDCGKNTASYGAHYCDYLQFGECNVSYPREMPESANHIVEIGHERICPNCGEIIDDEDDCGLLTHYDCEQYANERAPETDYDF